MVNFKKNFLFFILLFFILLFFNFNIYAVKEEENAKKILKEGEVLYLEKDLSDNKTILEAKNEENVLSENENILLEQDDSKKKIADFFELIIKKCNDQPSSSNNLSHIIKMSDLISKIDSENNYFSNSESYENHEKENKVSFMTTSEPFVEINSSSRENIVTIDDINNDASHTNNNILIKHYKYFKYLFLSLMNLFLGSVVCYFVNDFFS